LGPSGCFWLDERTSLDGAVDVANALIVML
jgi:hypothetical protein